MKPDVTAVLLISDFRGRLILAAYGICTTFVAILNLGALHSAPVGIISLALLWIALVILATTGNDQFPLGRTLAVITAVAAITALQSWNVIDETAPGYAAWHMGAVTFLLMVLPLRGREGLAWIGFAIFAAITVVWAITIDRGALVGVQFASRHAATLLVGTLFALILRSANRTIASIQAGRLARTAAEAAAETAVRERSAQNARLDSDARPALERVLDEAPFTAVEREEFALLEGELRDGIRAAGFGSTAIAAETREARQRGVQVILLDDRGAELAEDDRVRVETALLPELRATRQGRITARLSPYGRDEVATIVVDEGGEYRRIAVP